MLAPVVFAVVGYATMAVLNEIANPSSALSVTNNWAVLMVLGAIFYGPGIAIVLVGNGATPQMPRAGRVVATIGLIWLSLVWILLVWGTAADTLSSRDDMQPSWTARLSAVEFAFFVTPFVLLVVANGRAAWLLWRRGTLAQQIEST